MRTVSNTSDMQGLYIQYPPHLTFNKDKDNPDIIVACWKNNKRDEFVIQSDSFSSEGMKSWKISCQDTEAGPV